MQLLPPGITLDLFARLEWFTASANRRVNFVLGAVTAIFILGTFLDVRNGAPPNMLALLCFDTLGYVPSHLHPRVSAQVHRRHALLSASDASAPPAAPLPTPARLLLSRRCHAAYRAALPRSNGRASDRALSLGGQPLARLSDDRR